MIFQRPDPLQHFKPVDPRQPDVEQHHVELAFGKRLQAVLTAFDRAGLVSLVLQHAAQRGTNPIFVIDDQYLNHLAELYRDRQILDVL